MFFLSCFLFLTDSTVARGDRNGIRGADVGKSQPGDAEYNDDESTKANTGIENLKVIQRINQPNKLNLLGKRSLIIGHDWSLPLLG